MYTYGFIAVYFNTTLFKSCRCHLYPWRLPSLCLDVGPIWPGQLWPFCHHGIFETRWTHAARRSCISHTDMTFGDWWSDFGGDSWFGVMLVDVVWVISPPSNWQVKIYRDSLLLESIEFPVVTDTGRGDNPRCIIFNRYHLKHGILNG